MATKDKRLTNLTRAAVAGAAQGLAAGAAQHTAQQNAANAQALWQDNQRLHAELGQARAQLARLASERDAARETATRLAGRVKEQQGQLADSTQRPAFANARMFYDDELLAVISGIVSMAKKHVIIASPYIHIWPAFRTKLVEARHRGVRLFLICRTGDVDAAELGRCQELFDEVRAIERLHSKCYLNERAALVSSMNLLRSSLGNHELGVLIEGGHPEYQRLATVLLGYRRASVDGDQARKSDRKKRTRAAATRPAGHCIRCKASIDRNAERPLCSACYPSWARYKNPTYKEKHCHSCGIEAKTSFAAPLCRSCYAASKS